MGFQFTVTGFRFGIAAIALLLIFGCLGNGTQDLSNDESFDGPLVDGADQLDTGNATLVPGGQVPVTGNGTQDTGQETGNGSQDTVPGGQVPVNGNETQDTEPETGNGGPDTTPLGTPTNLSIDDLMEQELGKLDAPGAGPYKITTYQWKSNQFESDPQAIVINPTMQVLFDGETEQNLVGFAFNVYEPSEGGMSTANGIAVVFNQSMLIESKMAGTFGIKFDVPGFERDLSGISMTSKDNFINDKGQLLIVYGFDASSVQ